MAICNLILGKLFRRKILCVIRDIVLILYSILRVVMYGFYCDINDGSVIISVAK